MAVIDVITYNGEVELFDLRYNILKNYVDEFIVVEFDKTFSGKEKPYGNEPRGMEFINKYGTLPNAKIKYWWLPEDTYGKYKELATSSPNTDYGKGAEHWIREFCQKESIKDCLTHLKDDDIVFIGDCDEIWDPRILETMKPIITIKLHLLVYVYYLNNRSDEQFYGTLFTYYKGIKDKVLNHQRTTFEKTSDFYGWHFTSMGGPEALKKKLRDSYTEETYANAAVIDGINRGENLGLYGTVDFLGRGFTYWIDESDWPQYLKDNREKYKHLLK